MVSFKKKWINRLFGNSRVYPNNPNMNMNTNNDYYNQPLISTTNQQYIDSSSIINENEIWLREKAIELQDFFGKNVSLQSIIELLKKYENVQIAINTYYDNLDE